MEVILRETIDNLGSRGEIVDVKRGYARNFLLPQQMALPVTDANKRQVEREREAVEMREAEERKGAEDYAKRLQSVECVIPRRVGETNTLYGSVTSADIAEFYAQQQVAVDKRKIQLNEPLKELGEFQIAVRLHRDVKAEITVKVVNEAASATDTETREQVPTSSE
ncbi:50S ribosomal protein L9 [bacterium]|nr:MAG: 50S ribosomal protein L9 [bacterium]